MESQLKEQTTRAFDHNVTIIGAGSSGLSVAYHLSKQGVQSLIMDAACSAGFSWHKRHPQLSLNTHRIYSGLPGKPIPMSKGSFVTRDDYIHYLEDYAGWLQEKHHVSMLFNTNVTSVEPSGPYWRVITGKKSYLTRHVVVATGPDREPYIPEWEGADSYIGSIKHAADFGNIEQYDDKHVLIVGGANSGIDIANHLTERNRCASLSISMRHGSHLLPTFFAGLPVQLTGPVLAKLPLWCQDLSGKLFSWVSFGNLTKYGVQTPTPGVASRLKYSKVAPGFDQGFVKALKKQQIKVRPDISRLTSNEVRFMDGTHQFFDNIICATGYRKGLSRLFPKECLQRHASFFPPNPAEHLEAAASTGAGEKHPGLWIFGMQPKLEGSIYARKKEAADLADLINASLCSEAAGIEVLPV